MTPHNNKTADAQRVELSERMVRVEEAQKSTRDEIGAVRQEISSVAHEVGNLTRAVNNMGKPNWQVWVGVFGVCCVLITGGVSYVNTPDSKQIRAVAGFNGSACFGQQSSVG